MDGAKIFCEFTLRAIPECVTQLLEKSGRRVDEIDRFVFHQANQFMLEHLRKKLGIPSERFSVALANCGNTVCASIPIAMKDDYEAGMFHDGGLTMLVGFGVGYSWGATLVRWPGCA